MMNARIFGHEESSCEQTESNINEEANNWMAAEATH